MVSKAILVQARPPGVLRGDTRTRTTCKLNVQQNGSIGPRGGRRTGISVTVRAASLLPGRQ
jgi:hypothetical protein